MKYSQYSKRKKIAIITISLYALFAIPYFATNLYVDNQLGKRIQTNIFTDCHKVWATRGLVTEGDLTLTSSGNSKETLALAFQSGAKGSEIDVYYDVPLGHYVVSHDYPYDVKDGKLLSLEELLTEIGPNFYIWLDFKKMGRLDEQQVHNAASQLNKIAAKVNNKNKLYIESEDPVNLGVFRDAGFNTIFDTQPLTEDYWVSEFVINIYKMAYYFGDFTVMAMNSGNVENPIFGKNTQFLLKKIPLFIYHVPNKTSYLQELANIQNVHVILNTNHSVNRYEINSCE
jgi:hypothetical protein